MWPWDNCPLFPLWRSNRHLCGTKSFVVAIFFSDVDSRFRSITLLGTTLPHIRSYFFALWNNNNNDYYFITINNNMQGEKIFSSLNDQVISTADLWISPNSRGIWRFSPDAILHVRAEDQGYGYSDHLTCYWKDENLEWERGRGNILILKLPIL